MTAADTRAPSQRRRGAGAGLTIALVSIIVLLLGGAAAATVVFVPAVHDVFFGGATETGGAAAKAVSNTNPVGKTSASPPPLGSTAATLQPLAGNPPPAGIVQDRFLRMDARGDSGIYKMATEGDVDGEGAEAEVIVHPAAKELRVSTDKGFIHFKDHQVAFKSDGKTLLLRDYGLEPLQLEIENPGEFSVVKVGPRAYNITDGEEVTQLVLDDRNRFLALTSLEGGDSLAAAYTYEGVTMPTLPTTGERVPAFIAPFPTDVEGGNTYFGELPEEAAKYKGEELEFHFVDHQGRVLKKVPVEAGVNGNGWYFKWLDRNGNRYFDGGDRYEFSFEGSEVANVRFYDDWASAYPDEYDYSKLPGVEPLLLVVGAVAASLWVRRRRA